MLFFSVETYVDCLDAYNQGKTTSGVYTIRPDGMTLMKVYCDHDTDGGGWTVSVMSIDKGSQVLVC